MSDSQFNAINDNAFESSSSTVWESNRASSPQEAAHEPLAAALPKSALDWHAFVRWLPRLGPVLWLYQPRAERIFPRARLLLQGVLLLDHPALAALAECARISARSDVAALGPHEWLEFRTVRDECIARLYLLPDTDYLAWDRMLDECAIERIEPQPGTRWQAHAAFFCGALSRLRSPWLACVTRFPLQQLPCLQVLGMRLTDSLSPLGAQIAAAIAHDERAMLRLPDDLT